MIDYKKLTKIFNYRPDFGETRPDGFDFEARVSHVKGHWNVKSLSGATLKGRGCKDLGDGYYLVTDKAFEKMLDAFNICQPDYLD